MNKEQIYDAEIFPLMAQIIAVCQKNNISMFATYDLPTEEDDSLVCTTCLADESGKPSARIREFNLMAQLQRSPQPLTMMTIHKPDGSTEKIASL